MKPRDTKPRLGDIIWWYLEENGIKPTDTIVLDFVNLLTHNDYKNYVEKKTIFSFGKHLQSLQQSK